MSYSPKLTPMSYSPKLTLMSQSPKLTLMSQSLKLTLMSYQWRMSRCPDRTLRRFRAFRHPQPPAPPGPPTPCPIAPGIAGPAASSAPTRAPTLRDRRRPRPPAPRDPGTVQNPAGPEGNTGTATAIGNESREAIGLPPWPHSSRDAPRTHPRPVADPGRRGGQGGSAERRAGKVWPRAATRECVFSVARNSPRPWFAQVTLASAGRQRSLF
jgi:hypothetical protein